MLKLLLPVKNCVITSLFNSPRSYPFAASKFQLHEGIDFAPKAEDRNKEFLIYPAKSGSVLTKGFDAKGYGNYVVIQHDSRYFTWYAHLEYPCALSIAEGVSLNTVLGSMGSTGNATGKHLHFTLQDFVAGLNNYVVAKVVDPKPYLVSKIDTIILDNLGYNVVNNLLKG